MNLGWGWVGQGLTGHGRTPGVVLRVIRHCYPLPIVSAAA